MEDRRSTDISSLPEAALAVRDVLYAFEPQRRAVAPVNLKRAAVCVAYGLWESDPSIAMTVRAAGLRAHPGQWALPGGKLDGEETAQDGALRELTEELGVEIGRDAVLVRSPAMLSP